MAASPTKMFTLISSDGERFEVTEAADNMSQLLRHMIEDGCADGGIPIPNVNATILAKVLEYCNKHAAGDDLASFNAAFVDVDHSMLYELLLAANYLEIQQLLEQIRNEHQWAFE